MIAIAEERAPFAVSVEEHRMPYADAASRSPGTRVAEERASYAATASARPPLHEAQLFALWRGRRFPAGALVTRAGVPVTVIFQGRPGRGPGPDFRDAVIAGPSGAPLRGDVELHVREADFRAHGHHHDAAYANVVLHVVFEDGGADVTALPGGRTAPVVALAPWVARRSDELRRWIERPLLWREPCHDAVMRMGGEGVSTALDAEGDRRQASKAAGARERVERAGIGGALYEGLLEAMGYGGNAPAMLALGRMLPWPALREASGLDLKRMEALLLGCAGLLPSQRRHRGPVEPYVRDLEATFAASGLPSLSPSLWKLWGVRPANMPARRIAAAAALLRRHGDPLALLGVLGARTAREVTSAFAAATSPFWRDRYDPCAGPCRLPPAAIGRARALEIALNVVVPVAVASGDATLAGRARALYEKLPRPAVYGVTRFIEQALASEGVRVPVNARRAQGLLALHRDWCMRNGCGRCPLS